MYKPTFFPKNKLEESLVSLMNGEIDMASFLQVFFLEDVYIASASEGEGQGFGIEPLFFQKEDELQLAVFTASKNMEAFKEKAPFCLKLKGSQLIGKLSENYGLVLNPSLTAGFELPHSGVLAIREDFKDYL